ncbi:anhydro-N-acetylmuramic acid kinase [Massilia sp. H6]|uniref:anhydro-N-acetylmuramic acid kinase n=1 Tax=Massilia sp. H6 TaxID=2970464 RepID=UPI002167F698|nr:anhydro-N-acetylmuramic acid kinase [Massilia sp. H6]UVW29411.1 anhydro-N-acetylmuramic acid kinase [Massilia sp. H6]
MSQTPTLYIGLMSGTSLDGVDGVLADFADGSIQTIAAAFTPFPPALRGELMALQAASENELEREALAANDLALCYADCVRQLLPCAATPVAAIAVHGQTIRHRPERGFTRQTNNPAMLAELCGIDVIADFRSRDIAAGGQGAPLVPAFHQAAFGEPGTVRAVVNIGGIGNISVLHGDGRVSGFDTGPGNVLMDLWIGRHQGKPYDADGAWAASGAVHAPLLEALLDEPYFRQPGPKSTGRDLFHDQWLNAKLAGFGGLAPQDVMATLTRLTAVTIAEAIRKESAALQAVYVCGGGAYNATLLREIGSALGGIAVASTQVLGVAPNRVEALAFAWLGYRFIQREPGNLPAVTGARGLRILGALYPA